MPVREQPDQVYYPSARVRLFVRFESFDAKDTPAPPKKPPQLRDGKSDPELVVAEREGILVLEPKGSAGGGQIGPSSTQPSSDDGYTHQIDGIIPRMASHERNGVRMADTLRLTFRFEDFPFDPRTVRSCGVEFYLGAVSAENFSAGLEGGRRSDGASLSLIDDTFTDRRGRLRSNLRFQGWVDEWSNSFEEESEPTVELTCTDYTRILIDQAVPPKLTIDPKIEIDKAIANYLANFPQFVGVGVAYIPKGATKPKLEEAMAKNSFKPTLGPSPQGNEKLNVWDYLTDVTRVLGLLCHIETTRLQDGSHVPTIVIQRPRTFYAARFSGRDDDPFTGRILPSGKEVFARTFVYGVNVQAFEVSRKYTKAAPQNIEVRCYSCKQKKTLVVRFPEKDKREKKLAPGNEAEQKWEVVIVDGIDDEKTLRAIAQGVYESTQRGELTAGIQTRNLASLGGSNLDPDILDVLAGDAIELQVNQNLDDENELVQVEEAMRTRAVQFLLNKGYSQAIADAYAKAKSHIRFPTSFRVKSISTEWSTEEGVQIDLEVLNFVDGTREETDLPEGEQESPDPSNADPERVEL